MTVESGTGLHASDAVAPAIGADPPPLLPGVTVTLGSLPVAPPPSPHPVSRAMMVNARPVMSVVKYRGLLVVFVGAIFVKI